MGASGFRINGNGYLSGSKCKGVRPADRSVGARLVERVDGSEEVGVFDWVMTHCRLEVESYRRGVRRCRVV